MTRIDATSTADDVLADRDLSGTVALVTGAASGLGRETARAMAARGATLVLAGRDPAALAAVSREIAGEPQTLTVDLASLDSIARAGEAARDRFERIDILVNNAGVMACPPGRTADGFELQFGTNHLGHFALTRALWPLLEKGAKKRVVTLSSRAHHRSPMMFDDPNYMRRDYDKWEAYGQSKTANVLFTVALQARAADRGFDCFAVHPGGIRTNLGRHLDEEDVARLIAAMAATNPAVAFKSEEQGAATTVWAATDPALESAGGRYCEDCRIADVNDDDAADGVRSYAVDRELAERLWTMSEASTGAPFEL